MHLVILETGGNQQYIFSTNRLRENVGASELTYQAGTEFVLKAVAANKGPDLKTHYGKPQDLRAAILDAEINNGINGIEIVLATSGKAILLVKEKKVAQNIVRLATQRALLEAPGLDLCGVVHLIKQDGNFSNEMRTAFRELEQVRCHRSGTQTRFPMLPIASPCNSSGAPAYQQQKYGDTPHDLSRTVHAKADPARFVQWRNRLVKITKKSNFTFPKDADSLEALGDGNNWSAVVHADGNGLGEIFLNFEKYAGEKICDYVKSLREFSCEIEQMTEAAFSEALKIFPQSADSQQLAMIPLLIGGDDLTVICDGHAALPFAIKYLQAFEEKTKKSKIISPVCEKILGTKSLSACAGIAIVKRHFPFHHAYDLAEQLISSAKQVKLRVRLQTNGEEKPFPCSAIDFHILYDSSFTNLANIRERLLIDHGETSLTAKPYVVSDITSWPKDNSIQGKCWATEHHWSGLQERIKQVLAPDHDGRPLLSSSQLHLLREKLQLGKSAADANYKLICSRHPDFENLGETNDDKNSLSLFRKISPVSTGSNSTDSKTPSDETRFLDALDAAAFCSDRIDLDSSKNGSGRAARLETAE